MATNTAHGSTYVALPGFLPSTSRRLCCARTTWLHASTNISTSSREKKRVAVKCAGTLIDAALCTTSFPLKLSLSYCTLSSNGSQSSIGKISQGSYFIKCPSGINANFFDTSSMKIARGPHAMPGPNEAYGVTAAVTTKSIKRQENDTLSSEERYGNSPSIKNLNSKLPSLEILHRGQLGNGLEYVILPHNVPPNRVDCAIEVHVGSIDEGDDEQGISHVMEYVSLLGSKKCGELLGAGISSSSYTDFHHTVFHIHSPISTKEGAGDLLPLVMEALHEMAFQPKILASHLGNVRNVILSEMDKMNNTEYLTDCQLLRHLHSENRLGERFPIGLEEHIKNITVHRIKKFHRRWYNPANTTLYIVGDIDSISNTVQKIEKIFGRPGLDNEAIDIPKPISFDDMASFFVPSLPSVYQKSSLISSTDQANGLRKSRDGVRTPLVHNWSFLQSSMVVQTPQIFEHDSLQDISVNIMCKIPVKRLRTYHDMREIVMKEIYLSAFHSRIDARHKESNTPFSSIELQYRETAREQCGVTTLKVVSDPLNWNSALKIAFNEVRQFKEFGITKDELSLFMHSTFKRSEEVSNLAFNVPSTQFLRYIMESIELGHTVMNHRQAHECLAAIANTLSLEEVNSIGGRMLEFISDFGSPGAPASAAIVAFVPANISSQSNLSDDKILAAIYSGLEEPIRAKSEIEVPAELISTKKLDELKEQLMPSFVALPSDLNLKILYDEETGITQRYLSNGIAVNYKVLRNESSAGVLRLIACGGRAAEDAESIGAVLVGVRTLTESACIGNYTREQVELFCLNNNISYSLESTEEYVSMEVRFTSKNSGMRAAFQLLHMLLEDSIWLDDAFEKAKEYYVKKFESIDQSVEGSTSYTLMKAFLNGDERLVKPSPDAIKKLTLQSAKEAVLRQLFSGNMEMSIVGDFSEKEIESHIIEYIGTVGVRQESGRSQTFSPVGFAKTPSDSQFQHLFFQDSIDSACAYIAGPAPNRWGFASEETSLYGANGNPGVLQKLKFSNGGKDVDLELTENFRKHPLFLAVTVDLLAEIVKSRLLTTVEGSLKLADGLSFELKQFDCLNLGWFAVSIKSTPTKIYKAVAACMNVLRGFASNRIEPNELDRAKRIVLRRHESDIKSTSYWLKLMAHLQSTSVPRKDISSIRDVIWLYEAATIDDIYLSYKQLKVDEDSIFCYIALSGSEILRQKLDNMMQKLEKYDKAAKMAQNKLKGQST